MRSSIVSIVQLFSLGDFPFFKSDSIALSKEVAIILAFGLLFTSARCSKETTTAKTLP